MSIYKKSVRQSVLVQYRFARRPDAYVRSPNLWLNFRYMFEVAEKARAALDCVQSTQLKFG